MFSLLLCTGMRSGFFFPTCSTNTAPSGAIGSAFTMFSPTEITWPVVGFPVRIISARLLWVFALWFLRTLHLHLMDIFRFLYSLIHILKLCVRDCRFSRSRCTFAKLVCLDAIGVCAFLHHVGQVRFGRG